MNNKKYSSRILSAFVCLVLITAMAFSTAGCGKNNVTPQPEQGTSDSAEAKQVSFTFIAIDADGKEDKLEITTTEKTVGAALLKEGLIEGEDGQYGLYVKKVNGIVADYDKDGTYWAFYINGEYASTGVDSTEIVPGSTYTFKIEK